jgi:hypothetical protein
MVSEPTGSTGLPCAPASAAFAMASGTPDAGLAAKFIQHAVERAPTIPQESLSRNALIRRCSHNGAFRIAGQRQTINVLRDGSGRHRGEHQPERIFHFILFVSISARDFSIETDVPGA